jgi:uncharacterized protein
MLIGTIEAVRRYPIKSLRGEALDSTEVRRTGIPGDRASAFVINAGNERVGKAYRGKEDERLHLLSDADEAVAKAAERGVDIDLRRGDHFHDDAPVSIVVDSWLEGLNSYVGYPIEWERFRPNFFVRSTALFSQSESELVNAELRLGGVGLRVRSPIERCVVVTYHPRGGPMDPRILRYLAQERNATMGIYCDVVDPGIARLGDSLVRGV